MGRLRRAIYTVGETAQAIVHLGCRLQVSRHRNVMNLYDKVPLIAKDAFVAPNASLVGNVKVGKGSSLWYGCVLKGDANNIRTRHGQLLMRRFSTKMSAAAYDAWIIHWKKMKETKSKVSAACIDQLKKAKEISKEKMKEFSKEKLKEVKGMFQRISNHDFGVPSWIYRLLESILATVVGNLVLVPVEHYSTSTKDENMKSFVARTVNSYEFKMDDKFAQLEAKFAELEDRLEHLERRRCVWGWLKSIFGRYSGCRKKLTECLKELEFQRKEMEKWAEKREKSNGLA